VHPNPSLCLCNGSTWLLQHYMNTQCLFLFVVVLLRRLIRLSADYTTMLQLHCVIPYHICRSGSGSLSPVAGATEIQVNSTKTNHYRWDEQVLTDRWHQSML
jgi:hypothetical protein